MRPDSVSVSVCMTETAMRYGGNQIEIENHGNSLVTDSQRTSVQRLKLTFLFAGPASGNWQNTQKIYISTKNNAVL